MDRIDRAWGRLLEGCALLACVLVGAVALMICLDVLLRNVPLVPGVQGLAWSNELSELALYLITMLAAPWLLRQGQHIRVDIVLRILPGDTAACCLPFSITPVRRTEASTLSRSAEYTRSHRMSTPVAAMQSAATAHTSSPTPSRRARWASR